MPLADGFEAISIRAGNHELKCYTAGHSENVLLCLNGGPGLPSRYLRAAHLFLAEKGFRVVAYDQLDCGASARPGDPKLWTIARYAEEVEAVRKALGLGRFDLLGHSWGGWLAVEYMARYGGAVRSLVLADTCANIPHLSRELARLRAALGAETEAMMLGHEADGTLEHPEYQAAVTLLNHRHVCRLRDWPEPLSASLAEWNMAVYRTMQGANEFLYTGNLSDWNRWDSLSQIRCPVLIVVGQHDEITPACAREMHERLPASTVAVFRNSSHMPFYEEAEVYRERLLAFLSGQG